MEITKIMIAQPIPMIGELTACIGYFDGIHRGHQRLIETVINQSKQDHTIPAMITFDPDPWVVLRNCEEPPHLTSIEDRMRIAQSLGIQHWIVLQFNQELADVSVDRFHEMLTAMGIKTLICGGDFHYARQGQGNVHTLMKQNQFQTIICDAVMDGDAKISSSQIEMLIETGEISHANALLGYPYTLSGIIVKGKQIGRTMGFPTANLQLNNRYILPKGGVYAGKAILPDHATYTCIINIGHNPTFHEWQKLSVEAHLLDYEGDLYGTGITLEFHHYLRLEQRFPSKNALRNQLLKDKQSTYLYFKEE